MKRQYKKRIFQSIAGNNTGLIVNLIRRKRNGKPFDVIEVIYSTLDGDIYFKAAPEEALEIAWGLIKTTHQFLREFEPYKIFRSQKSIAPWSKKKIWWSID